MSKSDVDIKLPSTILGQPTNIPIINKGINDTENLMENIIDQTILKDSNEKPKVEMKVDSHGNIIVNATNCSKNTKDKIEKTFKYKH